MSDPIVPKRDTEAFRKLTAKLATLDLDPCTLEMLIAVLNADLDLREGDLEPTAS
jgi:hypothetical protein